MPIRNSRPLIWRARGLSDTADATNAFPGAMAALQNLIPSPGTLDDWEPRAASTQLTDFTGFSTPARGEALFAGSRNRLYGFIQSARFANKSEPFIYDLTAAAFVSVSGVVTGNCPTSTSNSGEWTPPTLDQVGAYVLATHPGFNFAGGQAFGWFDMSGFSDATRTGNTHTSTLVDNLSTNVLTVGWRPGMTITDSAGDLPAGTRISSIATNGLSLTLSAAATGSNAGTTFTVAGGTFAAPLWAAGNLNQNPLPALAVCVTQYAGSACFGVNTTSPPSAAEVFSDAGDPLVRTDASAAQVVTFRNAVPITAAKGLPLNTLNGGIIQSLLVFQGPTAIQQITGTPTSAANPVSLNSLNESTGTNAPNSVQSTPKGLLFAAPDGIRRIDFSGNVSPVLGRRGAGISTPFIFATNPSRMAAAYNEAVYRITVQNGAAVNTPTQEYWLHLDDDQWTGPHTFPATLIAPTQSPHGFALFADGINAKLWESNPQSSLSATFVENGAQMTFNWQTALLPDTGAMSENAMVETAVSIAIPPQQTVQANFTAEEGAVIGSAQISGSLGSSAVWGSFNWGAAAWGGSAVYYRQRRIPWGSPITFKQGQLSLLGNCTQGLKIGNLHMRYEALGYLLLPTG